MIARIRKVSLPEKSRILAVSDIHGELDYFKGLLEKIGFGAGDALIIVGDMLEKYTKREISWEQFGDLFGRR